MKKKSKPIQFLLLLFLFLPTVSEAQKTKKVSLHLGEVCLFVPHDWRIEEWYRTVKKGSIMFEVRVKKLKKKPFVSLDIYDSIFGPHIPVSTALLDTRIASCKSNPMLNVVVLDSAIRNINGVAVGEIKFRIIPAGRPAKYVSNLFFYNTKMQFNLLEIGGVNTEAMLEHLHSLIFNSINLDFSKLDN